MAAGILNFGDVVIQGPIGAFEWDGVVDLLEKVGNRRLLVETDGEKKTYFRQRVPANDEA
jgi:hypothetical protein